MVQKYKIVEQAGVRNTNIAAAATEQLTARPNVAPYWNYLVVLNFDTAVDTEILLDSGNVIGTAVSTGRYFRVQFNGGNLVIEPEDGLKFTQIVARNPHSATAQTADTIAYQWGYKEII